MFQLLRKNKGISIKFPKSKKRTLKEECWNLDYSFVLWLDKHLHQYLKDASRVIDLEYHKIEYKGSSYTLLELITKMLQITNKLTEEDFFWGYKDDYESVEKLISELLDIFKVTFHYLWW